MERSASLDPTRLVSILSLWEFMHETHSNVSLDQMWRKTWSARKLLEFCNVQYV